MSSLLNLRLLCAVTLLGTSTQGAPTASQSVQIHGLSGEPPSEEPEAERLSQSPVWNRFLSITFGHRKQFEEEFFNEVNYDFLERTVIPSPPVGCPVDMKKEVCFLRLAQGLQKYKVLLTHVKREYPDNPLLQSIKFNIDHLSQVTKEKMKHPERVEVLSDTEAEYLLQELDNVSTLLRKLTAHSILRKMHLFLIDSKRDLVRKENVRFHRKRQIPSQ